MGATTKKIDTTPTDITGLRRNMVGWLQNPNTQAPMQGPAGQQGMSSGQFNNQVQPFAQPNAAGVPAGGVNPGGYQSMGGNISQVGGPAGGYQQPNRAFGMMQSEGGFMPQGGGYTAGQPTDIQRATAAGDQQWLAGKAAWDAQQGQGGGNPAGGYQNYQNPNAQSVMGFAQQQIGNALRAQSPQQGPTGGFNNIWSQGPQGGPQAAQWVGPTPGAPQINPQMIDQSQMMFAQGVNPNAVPQVQGQMLNPQQIAQMSQQAYMGVQNPLSQFFNRGAIRDVGMEGYQGGGGGFQAQSIDKLGGVNSEFFRNMQGQLAPAFQQQRAEALAQAKEGLGNMGNGTALANSLGVAMNRSLGNEQAQLADYALQGLKLQADQQNQLTAMAGNSEIAAQNRYLQGQLANQDKDAQFLNILLGQNAQNIDVLQGNQGAYGQAFGQGANNALQGMLANQATGLSASGQNAGNWLQAAGLNNQAQIANSGQWGNMLQSNQQANLTGQMQNASNFMNNNQFNAQQAQGVNNLNANLGAQYQQLASQIGQQNAANYLQMLLGMGTTGVGPAQVVQQPGFGSALGGVVGMGLGAMAGGVGSTLGKQAGSWIGSQF